METVCYTNARLAVSDADYVIQTVKLQTRSFQNVLMRRV